VEEAVLGAQRQQGVPAIRDALVIPVVAHLQAEVGRDEGVPDVAYDNEPPPVPGEPNALELLPGDEHRRVALAGQDRGGKELTPARGGVDDPFAGQVVEDPVDPPRPRLVVGDVEDRRLPRVAPGAPPDTPPEPEEPRQGDRPWHPHPPAIPVSAR